MDFVLKFDRVTCSRCSGTGHYSYNQVSGSTCFKCEGAKQVLTAKGNRQRDYYRARTEIKIEDVKVGDRVSCDGMKFNVLEIVPSKSQGRTGDGPWITYQCLNLRGKTLSYGASVGSLVSRVLPTAEHNALLKEAIESQS
jgi:hypothetical protein